MFSLENNEKRLELPYLARKLARKIFKIYPPTPRKFWCFSTMFGQYRLLLALKKVLNYIQIVQCSVAEHHRQDNIALLPTHKYHEKIAKLSPSSSFSYTELALFPLLYHPATRNSFKYDFKCKPKHSNKVY